MITHGKSQHPLYVVRYEMIARCHNPNNKSYRYYGGRGITVCEEWRGDPRAFIDWALSCGWELGLHVDRIDNDGGYSPENCRFITRTQNMRNSSATKLDEEKVARIKARLEAGESRQKVADDFNISRGAIRDIDNGNTWKTSKQFDRLDADSRII